MLRSQLLVVTTAATCLLTLAGCRSAQPQAKVSGTATYRERIALPPDAVFEATLEDVSRADAPATTVGTARIENPGNPPYRFEIPYDPKQIDERHSYSVRARVVVAGQLMFTTDRATPVITRGNPTTVDLLLRGVRAASSEAGPGLEGTRWVLTTLGGAPITVAERQQAPDLTLDAGEKQVAGNGGCNRFTGSYRLDGASLSFGALAATMRMCVAGMELEQGYLAALGSAAGWRIAGGRLELLDAGGAVLAHFAPGAAQ